MGLGPALYGDAKWLDLLVEEPLLLRLPLVRCAHQVTIGVDEATWTQWIADGK
jgi:arsenate reductase-like glutaredoxin family protein